MTCIICSIQDTRRRDFLWGPVCYLVDKFFWTEMNSFTWSLILKFIEKKINWLTSMIHVCHVSSNFLGVFFRKYLLMLWLWMLKNYQPLLQKASLIHFDMTILRSYAIWNFEWPWTLIFEFFHIGLWKNSIWTSSPIETKLFCQFQPLKEDNKIPSIL